MVEKATRVTEKTMWSRTIVMMLLSGTGYILPLGLFPWSGIQKLWKQGKAQLPNKQKGRDGPESYF